MEMRHNRDTMTVAGRHGYGRESDNDEIEIIDLPQLKGMLRNVGEWSFTTVMWILWAYLFLPLINLIMWAVGGRHLYVTIIEEAHYHDIIGMIQKTGWFVLAIFLIMRGWGYYNYHRFGKRERRRSVPPASTQAMAVFFNLPQAAVERLQGQKEVIWMRRYEQS